MKFASFISDSKIASIKYVDQPDDKPPVQIDRQLLSPYKYYGVRKHSYSNEYNLYIDGAYVKGHTYLDPTEAARAFDEHQR